MVRVRDCIALSLDDRHSGEIAASFACGEPFMRCTFEPTKVHVQRSKNRWERVALNVERKQNSRILDTFDSLCCFPGVNSRMMCIGRA